MRSTFNYLEITTMSFMVRATFVIPYQPHPVHSDLIRNLVASNRFQRLVTAPNLVSVQTGCESEEAGEELMRKFGTGIQQIVDADIKARMYLTPVGERKLVECEFNRRKKAEKADVPVPVLFTPSQWKLSFSASGKPGAFVGEFAVVRDGERLQGSKGVPLVDALNVHEAVYDCAVVGLTAAIEDMRRAGEELFAPGIALVSPSQTVIKQLRGEWKMESASLVDRACAVQTLLGAFDREKVSFHLPQELRQMVA